MRGTTGGQKMYGRGTRDEQQRYNRCPTPNREYIIPHFILNFTIKYGKYSVLVMRQGAVFQFSW